MRDSEARQCSFTRDDGLRCRAYAITDSDFCNTHSGTREELLARASRGGQGLARKRRETQTVAREARAPIEWTTMRRVEEILRELLAAKLPGGEADFPKASVALLLVWKLFDPPEPFEQFAAKTLPREVAHRAREAERVAREELDRDLRGLGFKPVSDWLADRDQSGRELLHLMNERA
jgi:hypothetical protein